MKIIIQWAFILFLAGALQAQTVVIYDKLAESREITDFKAIKVSDAIDLYLSQAEGVAVAVSAADEKHRDRIRTSVENGVLRIWYDNDSWRHYSGNRRLTAYVSFNTLDKLTASGACDVYVQGMIKGEGLSIDLSGASDFKGSVDLSKLDIEQSGASDATLSGKAGTLKIQASGASDLKGFELQAENCHAHVSGASDIKITVSKELKAEASGASSIHYKGPGIIKSVSTSGASSVTKRS